MRTINNWITFNDVNDKYREVMAVLVKFDLDDDHQTARAEVPFLGIVVEGDGTALMQACSLAQGEISRRYKGQIRQGLQTQATYAETREVRYTETDGAVFDAARCLEEEVARRGASLYYVLGHVVQEYETAALADANAELAVGLVSGAQTLLEERCGDVEADAAISTRPVGFDENATRLVVDGDHFNPVSAAKNTPVEDVTHLESVNGRRIDHDFTTHNADSPGDFCGGRTPGQGGIPRQLGLFFVDDLSGKHAEGCKKLGANGKGPSSKVISGINDDNFAVFGCGLQQGDFVIRHFPCTQHFMTEMKFNPALHAIADQTYHQYRI